MDFVERYRRIASHMFSDGIVNQGRLLVLRIYTDKLCESVTSEAAKKIRKEYHKLIAGFVKDGNHTT